MRLFLCAAVSSVFLFSSTYAQGAEDVRDVMAHELAVKVQRAIVDIDLKAIDGMISDMYFVDDPYERCDVIELLYDKYSWLYRMLFDGDDSVRGYFMAAQNVEYVFHWDDQIKDHVTIIFKSSNFPREKWPECSLGPVNGVMAFDNLFVY